MLNAVAFLALLCTVNAYFVVDVGDNDNDVLGKENSEVRSCNLRSCEQTCSRLGFPGGVCIGDKCKCDIIRAPAVHYKSSLYASCSPQGCAQSCRRIGFPGGACVGDRCKCDILRVADLKAVEELDHSRSLCDRRRCDEYCRLMGFPGGNCVGIKCTCSRRVAEDESDGSSQ